MLSNKINKKQIFEEDEEDNDLIINNEDDSYTEIEQSQNQKGKEKLAIKIDDSNKKAREVTSIQKVEIPRESKNYETSTAKKIFTPVPIQSSKKQIDSQNRYENELFNEDKTIFSKIAEDLYLDNKNYLIPKKNYLDILKTEEDNYNRLTIENYLFTCADKENSKNNKIISNFLERKTKEQNNKKIGNSDLEKNDIENLAEIRGLYSDRKNIKLLKNSSRSPDQFIKEQKIFEEKHKEYMNKLIKKYNEETKNEYKDKPTINKRSEQLANMNKSNKDIYKKLYEEFNILKQKKEEKIKNDRLFYDKRKIKKLKNEEIIENSKRLYQEYTKKKNNYNENSVKQLKNIMSMSAASLIEKKSNILVYKKLINKYKKEIELLFNKKLSDKFDINYNDYLTLMFRLGCVEKNYNEVKNNENKNLLNNNIQKNSKINDEPEQINIKNKILYSINILKKNIFIKSKSPEKNKINNESKLKLMNNSWKIISKSKEFSSLNKSNSFRLLLFFLSLHGIYKGDLNDNFIKKEFPFLSEMTDKTDYIDEIGAKQIYKNFQMFRNNAINYISLENKREKKTDIIEFKNEKMPKESKSFVKTIDYSDKNPANKINRIYSSSKNGAKIKYIKKIKYNTDKNNNFADNDASMKKDDKDNEIKPKNDNIIKDDDNIKNITNNHDKFMMNKLKKNLKPKKEKFIKKKLNLNKSAHSTKNIISKTNNSIISNKNANDSQKNIKSNQNNNTSKPLPKNQKANQNKNIKSEIQEEKNNENKISENSNIKEINSGNLHHQKEKNSSISNYIFNEDYRIKEDIESNSNLNNFEDFEKNENKKKSNNNAESQQNLINDNNNNINLNDKNKIEKKENNINEKKKKSKFVFKIKIKKKLIKLIIKKGDDIEQKIDVFCKENSLDEDDKKEILEAINSNLNE